MGITSKTKVVLKETYKSVKKSFNSFLKKLGLNNKETGEISKDFFASMKQTLEKHVTSKEDKTFLNDLMTQENEAIYENLRPLKPHRPAPPIPVNANGIKGEPQRGRNNVQLRNNKIQRPTEPPPLPPSSFMQEIIKIKHNLRKVEPEVNGSAKGTMSSPMPKNQNLTSLQKNQIKAINDQIKDLDQNQIKELNQDSELDK